MDLEEWEVLPEDGFLQIHHDDDGKKIFSRRFSSDDDDDDDINRKTLFKMNYFSSPNQFVETTNQFVSLDLVQFSGDDHNQHRTESEKDRVFFKKMEKSEFPSDMKLDSPKSNNNVAAILSQVDQEPNLAVDDDDDGDEEETDDGVNVWNWGMAGIGAIFSVGVAAVVSTVCILLVGNRQKHRRNRNLRFEIYTDDKKIKQMVHHANRLNDSISGTHINGAQITIGGCYNAL